ncbi:MAG: outer membrane protein assembly factor BamE domain-containing protein [Burkholderiaceae bacterium]
MSKFQAFIRSLALILPLILLGGCDYLAQKTLEPGVSTEKDVRALMGRPGLVWSEEDGTRVLEYSRAPVGHETYMVTIGPDGLFRGMENVLTKERFDQIKTGMNRDQVRRLLGKPSEIEFFTLSKQEVWSFKHIGEMSDSDMFNVHFDMGGIVKELSVTRDPQMDNA